ncbi:glycosyltransferase [Tessaracoccus flavus]|uniref:Uncharacterized protein n=1 Tax=Tessaracoccus flavus TaxID=1610493 RepID=A0A1Q2CG96_9ACTN|nr:hypothetical protein [Tessaracoccus flavus]AQP45142.1 hypothetical protein RPIT_10340 [Tessaracoccus flavus]SDY55234.1 UDP:flavonoid glycosyltransferase YjiC, YdhE family [Tessaracoccus flavus]
MNRPRAATFLVVSTSITAHTLNASKIVSGLVGRGHRVLWYAADRFAHTVALCGAEHLPAADDGGFEDTTARGGGLGRVKSLFRDEVVGRAATHRAALAAAVGGTRIDAVISDTLIPAASLSAADLGAPWVTFGDGPLLCWDDGTPPFGTGLPFHPGRAGRRRNRDVQALLDRWLYRPFLDDLNALRLDAGLGTVPTVREATVSPLLHLQGCTPSFEYPRAAGADHVHFVGALGPVPGSAPEVPPTLTRSQRSRPLAMVTQGTLRPDLSELAIPAARALVAEGFDVLVAGAQAGLWNPAPERVTALPRVDYPGALAESDLFVTNGGYTGVTLAVAAGVPIVQAGNSEEKPDIGARVRWSGVGASLRIRNPPVWLLRQTIRRVMGSPARIEASSRLSGESSCYDAAEISARLLGELAERTRG